MSCTRLVSPTFRDLLDSACFPSKVSYSANFGSATRTGPEACLAVQTGQERTLKSHCLVRILFRFSSRDRLEPVGTLFPARAELAYGRGFGPMGTVATDGDTRPGRLKIPRASGLMSVRVRPPAPGKWPKHQDQAPGGLRRHGVLLTRPVLATISLART